VSGDRIDLDGRILGTLFWAALVNTVFLVFSLVRIFAAKEVKYGLADLFNPQFYIANPIFILLMIIFFVGLGTFNAVTTWIEDILRPRGFSSTQAGIVGGLMIAGGILGALVLPSLSDRSRKRTPFIIAAILGATLGLIGITYVTGYWLLLVAAFILGFFLLSAGPIGFQYGAEVTYPTPEGTSNGLLLLMGQISGIVFIFAMDSFKSPANGSMTTSLVVLVGLLVLCLLLGTRLKEPKTLLTEQAGRQDKL